MQFVVAGNDEAVRLDVVRHRVVIIERGLEVVEFAVRFGEAAVVIVPQAKSEAEVGTNLEFVLNVLAGFVGAIVPVGVSLQKASGNKAVYIVGDRHTPQEIGEIVESDHTFVGSVVPRVELSVGKAAAEGQGMPALGPNGVGRGHEAVLEDSRESTLGHSSLPDAQGSAVHIVCVVEVAVGVRRRIAKIVGDSQTREKRGAECVDSGVREGCAWDFTLDKRRELGWRKGLLNRAVDFLAD